MRPTLKAFLIEAAAGFLGVFLAAFGLAVRFIEVIARPFLAPTRFILGSPNDIFARLPGIFNIPSLAAASEGVYGIFLATLFALFAVIAKKEKYSPDA